MIQEVYDKNMLYFQEYKILFTEVTTVHRKDEP